MTPRHERKAVARYKRNKLPRRPRIKPADPAVTRAFEKLQDIWTVREEAREMPDFAPPDFLERCERDCWERVMWTLLRSPVPCD
jgi:hypothetical protein